MRLKTMMLASAITLTWVTAYQSASAAEPVKLCTGGKTGNYYMAGQRIKQQLGSVEVIETKGSVDNLDKLVQGQCDAAIAQADVVFVFQSKNPDALTTIERARDMYAEQVNLVCNDAVGSSDDLKRGNTVLVGADGSGSSVTWQAFVKADPERFGQVATLPIGGARALGKVTDGVDAQCMLFVAGLNSQAMKDANEMGNGAKGKLHLAEMRDSRVFALKDARGRQIYTKGSIPGGTYPGLQPRSLFGSSVPTVNVESILVGRSAFIEQHPAEWDAFLNAVTKAMPSINDAIAPKS